MLQPWYVRSHPLQQRTGSQIFHALYGSQPFVPDDWRAIGVLLESPYPPPANHPQPRLSRYSLCAGRPRQAGNVPRLWTPTLGSILPLLTQLSNLPRPSAVLLNATGQPLAEPLEPFAGGWLGWLGYDLAWEIESLPTLKTDPLPFPVAFWYEPETFAILDHQTQCLWLAATQPEQLNPMAAAISQIANRPPSTPHPVSGRLNFVVTQADYEATVQQAKAFIQAGDIFQANLSLRFSVQTDADSWTLYQHLQQINPSPFANYWRTPWGAIISCSPERLVALRGDRAETRPIAGTRARGHTPQQDITLAQELVQNTKERAEHIMLVDLERNDLGRVCQWGTVQVNELLTLEPYSHVMHLVSNVVGSLQPGKGPIDLIRATFPGGTITGCPKVRCMEIIEALEPVRRSLFYGSCGYLDWRGHLDLNILIRTMLWIPGIDLALPTVWGQVGAGIVADSDPTQEWRECLQKAKAQLLALGMAISAVSPQKTHPDPAQS